MEQFDFDKKSMLIRITSFSPQDYLNFDGYIVPGTINLVSDRKSKHVKIEAGNFSIGQTLFHFEGGEFLDSEDEVLIGKANSGPYQVTAHLGPNKGDNDWPPFKLKLSSKPEAAKQDILAQLYHGKNYASLTTEEKAAIDKLK